VPVLIFPSGYDLLYPIALLYHSSWSWKLPGFLRLDSCFSLSGTTYSSLSKKTARFNNAVKKAAWMDACRRGQKMVSKTPVSPG